MGAGHMETMKDLERQELPQDPNLNCCGVLRQSLLVEHDDDDEFTGQLPNIRHHKQHENMAADNPNHVKSDLDEIDLKFTAVLSNGPAFAEVHGYTDYSVLA